MVGGDVLICGIFDLLHLGHLSLIRKASVLGPVTVGLLTDRLAGEYKRTPVMSYWERKATLESLPWVERVVMKDTHDVRDILRQYEPAYLATGSDWTQDAFYELNCLSVDFMERNEVAFVVLPSDRTLTTTKLLERISGT
jgi:phosphoenolpyruvate phosphomutase